MHDLQISEPLLVRGNKHLPREGVLKILIRGTNWIGDAVMTLPAVAAVRKTWPQAQISVLAKPWVADIYREAAAVDGIVVFEEPGRHSGISGRMTLAGDLRPFRFDMAILLQNALEAAIIARLAGIPIRAGYNSDVRGWLLTHSVRRTPAIRKIHQIDYYLEMVKALGGSSAGRTVRLDLRPATRSLADKWLTIPESRRQSIIGMAPGAAYGPAKRWPEERFAALAARIAGENPATIILFGSARDREVTDAIAATIPDHCLNLAGKTSVREVMALISRCHAFITNDSGLMHVAGAMNIPTVAIFGSTNPVTTSPPGDRNIIVRKPVACSPCLKPVCPTDFKCMASISVDEVATAFHQALNGHI